MTARHHPARYGGLIRPHDGGGNKALRQPPPMIGFLVDIVADYYAAHGWIIANTSITTTIQ